MAVQRESGPRWSTAISVSRRLLLVLLLQLCLAGARLGSTLGGAAGACPTICACKWKGGKRTVECPERGLFTIPENMDPETQVLDLSGNNLQILPREAFVRAGLLNLQKAFLKECRLGQIDELAFHRLKNLVELDLSGNLLTAVPSQAFRGVPLLRELSLARNPIQKIDGHAFKTVPSLVKLDLGGCELRTLAPAAFDGLDLLETLRLEGNRLAELRPRTVDSLRRLSGVQLHDNPWHCDCRLRPLRDWMAAANVARPVEPICAEPRRLASRSLADLKPDDLACRPEMLIPPRWRVVEAPAGGNISLTCRAGGAPPPALFWAWGGRPILNGSTIGPPGPTSRVIIREEDLSPHERRSTLYLPDSREGETAELTCIAENKAGSAEANFSLRVTPAEAGAASLGSGQIAGLSAALIILILFIMIVIVLLMVRLRKPSLSSTKTPTPGGTNVGAAGVESGAVVGITANGKAAEAGCGVPVQRIVENSVPNGTNAAKSPDGRIGVGEPRANPVQKPPRLTEIPYTTSHYDGSGSVMGAPCYVSARLGGGAVVNNVAVGNHNNPDLVPEGDRVAGESNSNGLPSPTGSGRNARHHPPPGGRGIWESTTLAGVVADGYQIRRAVATSPGSGNSGMGAVFEKGIDASDRTPIIGDGGGSAGSEDDEEDDEDDAATVVGVEASEPVDARTQYPPVPPRYHHGGYPPDYGLPIPGAQTTTGTVVNKAPPPPPPPPPPPNAKTLRVWQRGVPVLPPVTALKRVLGSRDSPDEGYQEGCGTDV